MMFASCGKKEAINDANETESYVTIEDFNYHGPAALLHRDDDIIIYHVCPPNRSIKLFSQ